MHDPNGPTGLPGRGELFTDPAAKAIWAAVVTLPDAEQHALLMELRDRLACLDGTTSHATRTRRAVVCLREAAQQLGHSPSVGEYRELRDGHPEWQWPADSTIRSWLGGGSWNEALAHARLESVADGDVLIASLGSAFDEETICQALRDAARDLGDVPTFARYLAWARRPDVRARPGQRPMSQTPFVRVFGSFLDAVKAAGLLNGETPAKRTSLQRIASYRVTEETAISAIKMVAHRLGHSPRVLEYGAEREKLIAEALEQGSPVSLPAHSTIQKLYPVWDDALEAAGLERLGGRHTGKRRGQPVARTKPRYTEEQLVAAIREARYAIEGPLTTVAFGAWRKKQLEKAREQRIHRPIPHYDFYYRHYGNWDTTLAAALNSQDAVDGGTQELAA